MRALSPARRRPCFCALSVRTPVQMQAPASPGVHGYPKSPMGGLTSVSSWLWTWRETGSLVMTFTGLTSCVQGLVRSGGADELRLSPQRSIGAPLTPTSHCTV